MKKHIHTATLPVVVAAIFLLQGLVGCARPSSAPAAAPASTPAPTTAAGKSDSSLQPPNIPQPVFGSRTYNIKDFGAMGDDDTNDTPAINKAIDQCSTEGGGTIKFPAGRYLVASVHLKSNVRLLLDNNAVIIGAATGYDAPEPNPYDEFQDFGHSHFHDAVMWGDGIENFAIIGGAVDGGQISQADWKDPGTGNKVIAIKNGKNLLFNGVTHNNGGHFVYLLNNCENITIANDTIKKSRDGIDLMGCRNVAVHDCHFTGCDDDTLGIKSDWVLGKKILTENIYAWDCYFESGCNGVQFGSETAGDFRNINLWNIKIGLAMKAGIGITCNDGGVIDGVRFDHCEIKGSANPIFMLITNRLRSGDPDKKTGTIKNVRISNITISDMKMGKQGPIHCVTISGRPESWLENIICENVKITFPGGENAAEATIVPPYPTDYSPGSMKARPASGFYIRNVKGIELHNVKVDFETPDLKPPLVASDVDGLVLDRFLVNQKTPGIEMIRLDPVSPATINAH